MNGSRSSRVMTRALALLLPVSLAAQVPPVPPRPPPPPQSPPGVGPHGNRNAPRPPGPDRRPQVDGNMDGLLDHMTSVSTQSLEEIDTPVLGYGNELLWEAVEGAGATGGDMTPVATSKRASRQHKAK